MSGIQKSLSIVAACLLLLDMSSEAFAREKLTVMQGMAKCEEWCIIHSNTEKSMKKCERQCYNYWTRNGSDADSAGRL